METFDYYGTKLPKLGDDDVVLGSLVMIKMMNSDGKTVYREYRSSEIHPVEALGMVHTMTNSLEQACMAGATRPPQ